MSMGTAILAGQCVLWLAVAAALCLRLIRPTASRKGSGWVGSGALVVLSAELAAQFAHHQSWPFPRLLTVALDLVGAGCMAAGVVILQARNTAAAPAAGRQAQEP